jgi:hypothetical protein
MMENYKLKIRKKNRSADERVKADIMIGLTTS